MNDMQAVREAAERVRNGEYVYEPRAVLFHFSRSRMNDVCDLADAYISLTDPTLLTVELLVERGAQVEGNYYYFKGFFAYHSGGNRFDWYEITPGDLLQFPPRTVGELAMIELLMEGRS